MKVLILSQYFWPENFRVNEAAKELQSRGHEVTVLTGLPNYPGGRIFSEYRACPQRYSLLDGVQIVRVPLIPRGNGRAALAMNYLSFAFMAATLGWFKLWGRKFDVILAFQVSPATVGLPAVLLKWIKRASLVLWVQDLWPEALEASGIRVGWILAGADQFVRWVYRHCDHVLGQSHAVVEQIRSRAPRTIPVSYLPNWAPNLPKEPKPSTGSKQTFNIYFLGNLGEAQDLPSVMRAAGLLAASHEIHWHFVGDGSMAGWLRREVEDRGAMSFVHLHDPVPPNGLQPFLDDADALLVSLKPDPIFAMTVPSKVQSYLQSALPIIAMLDGEGASIIREAGAGFVVAAGDAEGLATVVKRLAGTSVRERAGMGAAGRRYGDTHFGFEYLIGRLEQVLRQSPPKS